MNRRSFLAALNRRAAAIAIGSLFFGGKASRATPPAAVPGGETPFTLGVASGVPRPDGVVLWTRLAPRPREPRGGLPNAPVAVRWEMAADDRFAQPLRSGEAIAVPEHAHSVHVEVPGLPPATPLHYRFIAGDHVSPVGRTRTAPAADADVRSLRIALASCQHYEQGAFAVHREIAARDFDFVLFVGDYIYESSNPRLRLRPHEAGTPTTLDTYRARHATYKLDADLQAAHAAHPWVLTWDDHEVENDYADASSPSGWCAEDFLRRRAAAYKAYFEHLPIAPAQRPSGPAMRLHDRVVWGQLAELWTLDGRQYRSPQACGLPPVGGGRVLSSWCEELGDASRSMLGAEQERWLAEGLAQSRRGWQLVAQQTQLSASGIDTPTGRHFYSDGWEGYPHARERLLRAIAEAHHTGAICLGGDVHRHVAAQLRAVPNDERSPVVASEFVATSLTTVGASDARMALIRRSNPDIAHGRSDERGYAAISLSRDEAVCDFRGTPFPVREGAVCTTQARYAVDRRRPGVHRG